MSLQNKKILIKLSKDECGSFGFSLLGKFEGIPHVVYEVNEDSPASDEVSEKLHKNSSFVVFSSSVKPFFL